jgi:hypothetical protein
MLVNCAVAERIERHEGMPEVAIWGHLGQLNVVNAHAMHAVKQCKTVRQALDSCKAGHESQQRMFH